MAHAPVRFEDRMSDGDALMWNIERATRAIPRLRQRVLPNPLASGFAEVVGVA